MINGTGLTGLHISGRYMQGGEAAALEYVAREAQAYREARQLEEQHHQHDNVFICDVCRRQIDIGELHLSFENANFLGNRTKRYHDRCAHEYCPGILPLLERCVRHDEGGSTQGRGDQSSDEVMDEICYMTVQTDIGDVATQEDDSEADDIRRDGRSWYKRCFLYGAFIYFLAAYSARIKWSVMYDFVQDVIGLGYNNEPNTP